MELETLISHMKSTHQTAGINMLEHGRMVHHRFNDLYGLLAGRQPGLQMEWKLPSWFT